MPSIRKQTSDDGLCTLIIGDSVFLTDLSEADADAIIAAYSRITAAA